MTRVHCKVKPNKYITLKPDEKNKRDLVQAGEEFVCSLADAKQYEKKELAEIVSTFPDEEEKEKVPTHTAENIVTWDSKGEIKVEKVSEEETKPTKPPVPRRRIPKN